MFCQKNIFRYFNKYMIQNGIDWRDFMNIRRKNQVISIDIDTTGMEPAQIRLLRSLNSMISFLLKADNESDYFDASAEAITLCASIIKQAHLPNENNQIEYANQALEYSIDILGDRIHNSKIIQYDN